MAVTCRRQQNKRTATRNGSYSTSRRGDPGASRKSPGHTEFAPIALQRGVTHDPEFENWANKVWSLGAGRGAEVSLKDFRKDIVLEP